MNKKFFVGIVAPISIVGLTLSLGLGSTAFGTPPSNGERQTQDDTTIQVLNVTTDIPVAPWCGWYVSGGPDGDLSLVPDEGAPTQYTGDEIALTATLLRIQRMLVRKGDSVLKVHQQIVPGSRQVINTGLATMLLQMAPHSRLKRTLSPGLLLTRAWISKPLWEIL